MNIVVRTRQGLDYAVPVEPDEPTAALRTLQWNVDAGAKWVFGYAVDDKGVIRSDRPSYVLAADIVAMTPQVP